MYISFYEHMQHLSKKYLYQYLGISEQSCLFAIITKRESDYDMT